MFKKIYDKMEFTYSKEDEGTEWWAKRVNKYKESGYEVTDIGYVGKLKLEKYIVFEKFYN